MRKSWFMIGLALAGAFISARIAADPNALWRIVHEQCVPNQLKGGVPAPCAEVVSAQDEGGGYAILKDRTGELQYLLIPTARLSGIESPALLGADAPGYWAAAWEARRFMAARYGRPIPREAVSLAINSVSGRTQEQLHIHVSCVKAEVRRRLAEVQDRLDSRWQPFPGKLLGHGYLARRIDAGPHDAAMPNPFRLLADGIASARDEMGRYTLAMLATTFADGRQGFVLLADRADPASGDRASAEELQDHDCAVLHP
ncbi:CDP-diacylglycerol diphosphatase [Paludibacterium yongneupense]|uniref:CDP-diacylglycerol diphosphatase n=1 Tax=Paludibacterium yongneupense TaxID=400061 RepID=UPI0003FEC9C0|nr:CDP-diacylglycerol diphosphatase [Paludibacterium yongneupense]